MTIERVRTEKGPMLAPVIDGVRVTETLFASTAAVMGMPASRRAGVKVVTAALSRPPISGCVKVGARMGGPHRKTVVLVPVPVE